MVAWQIAQQMELAPGGSCKGLLQFEQLRDMYMVVIVTEMSKLRIILLQRIKEMRNVKAQKIL